MAASNSNRVRQTQLTPDVIAEIIERGAGAPRPVTEIVESVAPPRPVPDITERVEPPRPVPEVIERVEPPRPIPEVIERVAPPRPVPEIIAPAPPYRLTINDLSADRFAPREVLDGCRALLARGGLAESPSIGVTSALRGEGRSTVALGIALVEARDLGRRTLLVELDAEQPSLARRLGIAGAPGIAELVEGRARFNDCLCDVGDNVTILHAGNIAGRSLKALSALVQGDLLERLRASFDVVVADLPALTSACPTPRLAREVEQMVLVIRAGITAAPVVGEAVKDLRHDPIVVLNQVPSLAPPWARRDPMAVLRRVLGRTPRRTRRLTTR